MTKVKKTNSSGVEFSRAVFNMQPPQEEALSKAMDVLNDNLQRNEPQGSLQSTRLFSFENSLLLLTGSNSPYKLNKDVVQSFESTLRLLTEQIDESSNQGGLNYYILSGSYHQGKNNTGPMDISPEFLAISRIVIYPLIINGGNLQVQMHAAKKPITIPKGRISTIQPDFAQDVLAELNDNKSDTQSDTQSDTGPSLQMALSKGKTKGQLLSLIGVEDHLDQAWLSPLKSGRNLILFTERKYPEPKF